MNGFPAANDSATWLTYFFDRHVPLFQLFNRDEIGPLDVLNERMTRVEATRRTLQFAAS